MSARPRPPARSRPPLVERSWFEPALLLVLVVLGGLAYAWYTDAVARRLGSRHHQAAAASTSR
jgi:hypothetical protein